jgi:general secretion pathway protein G
MKKQTRSGFTLIEVMVVVVILGIMAAIIVPNIIGRTEDAKIVKVKQDIVALENALEMYRLDNGFYPSTDQGLEALVRKPESDPIPKNWRDGGYIKQLQDDPWAQPYQYLNPGEHKEIDIFSKGKPGKQGEDNEIGNWSSESDQKEQR